MLQAFLTRLIRKGQLTLQVGTRTWSFGEPDAAPDMRAVMRVRDKWTALKIGLHPFLCFGEAYVDGTMTTDDLWQLLKVIGVNLRDRPRSRFNPFLTALRRLIPANSRSASRRNVAHHYDLSDRLYRLFLDKDMQYSCAYFEQPAMGLDAAQLAKKRHIAAKLALQPGQSVLDIGCGWGGMALHLARNHNARVTGVTLSREQFDVAQARTHAANASDKVSFQLSDYRDVAGRFDRIVSVGMFEHVGAANFETFFATVADKLNDDGVALIHTIGRKGEFSGSNAWINKYIFPGGYIPSLSQIAAAAEAAGLWITDVESLRLHYAETLKAWRERFQAHRDEIRALYDERFCRMWEFYLASCEMSFRYGDMMVYQVQVARRVDALPITRDYMMAPVAETPVSTTIETLKERASKVQKGVPGRIQPVGESEPR